MVVHIVRPLFPERLLITSGLLWCFVTLVRHCVVDLRVVIG